MELNNLDLVNNFQQALFFKDALDTSQFLTKNFSVEKFFPHKSNGKAFLRAIQQALNAMSDVNVKTISTEADENIVRMKFQVAGYHSAPLDFSFMKLPVIQPSGKLVRWPILQWEFSISDGFITGIRNTASIEKGMPGILKSFGMKTSIDHLDNLRNLLGLGNNGKKKKPSGKINPLRFLPLIPLTVLTILVLFVSSPINAVAWTPQTIPAWTGPLTPNDELLNADLLGLTSLKHPEDLAFDEQGRIYTGSDDGNIYRITMASTGDVETFETFAAVGGYPLGLAFDKTENLIATVKEIGLLSIAPSGEVTLLTNTVNETPITYANSLVIVEDGLIYFSDSSVKFDRGWPYDVLEARPNGRVLAYNPQTNQTYLIKDGMYFPNGMVLAPDGRYLLVNETTRYRIARYWLIGENQGTWDYFADNLPLLPDNISVDGNGNYLLAGGRRMAMIDKVQTNASLKNQMAKIPLGILRNFPNLKNNRYGLILILDVGGKIQHSLHDPEGNIYAISSARSYDGFIYIGTLLGQDIARYSYQP